MNIIYRMPIPTGNINRMYLYFAYIMYPHMRVCVHKTLTSPIHPSFFPFLREKTDGVPPSRLAQRLHDEFHFTGKERVRQFIVPCGYHRFHQSRLANDPAHQFPSGGTLGNIGAVAQCQFAFPVTSDLKIFHFYFFF